MKRALPAGAGMPALGGRALPQRSEDEVQAQAPPPGEDQRTVRAVGVVPTRAPPGVAAAATLAGAGGWWRLPTLRAVAGGRRGRAG